MNIDYYRIFLSVVDRMNITAAAETLGYTQSGISHIIAQIENDIGFPLLFRSKNGVSLTNDGERMLPYIREIVNRDDTMHQVANEVTGIRTGRVRIGTFVSAAVHWIPRMIKEFNMIYENVSFNICVGTYKDIEEMVLREEIDCGFVSGAMVKNLNFVPLVQDKLIALVPHDHPLAKKEKLPLDEIRNLDFIIPGEGSNHDIGQILKKANLRPNVRFSVSDDYAAISMVKNGFGITILPELVVDDIDDSVRKMHIDPECFRIIGIATASTTVSPACKAFIEFSREWVNAHH